MTTPPSDSARPLRAYAAEPVTAGGKLVDVRLVWPDRVWLLAGRRGKEAEEALAEEAGRHPDALPVFVGTGLGHGLRRFLSANPGRPCAVIDLERRILDLTGVKEECAGKDGVFWIDPSPAAGNAKDQAASIQAGLVRWQLAHGLRRLLPLALPVYGRLDPSLYGAVLEGIDGSLRRDLAGKARYAKFRDNPGRVVFLANEGFHLAREVIEAYARLGTACYPIGIAGCRDVPGLVGELLKAVLAFKPDYVLTINHFGIDARGALVDLLDSLRLPLASWFVDNPELILHRFDHLASDNICIFSTSAEALEPIRARGYIHVRYLPLATSPERFAPPAGDAPAGHPWRSAVSFVGNSWASDVCARMKSARLPAGLLRVHREIAREMRRIYQEGGAALPADLLSSRHPALFGEYEALGSLERQRMFDVLSIWEANRQYRLACVEKLLPFEPLIVGDRAWKSVLRGRGASWRWLDKIRYYEDLPGFYPLSGINFNCTSVHMRSSLNQRLFDVPACGAFVLTDCHPQLERHFEPGREVAVFESPDGIAEAVARYLKDRDARRRIALAGRRRVLSEHTYAHRLASLDAVMRDIYD